MGEQDAEFFLPDIVLKVAYKITKKKTPKNSKRERTKAFNSVRLNDICATLRTFL